MKPLKFRVWDKNINEMNYFELNSGFDCECGAFKENEDVMQYIGLNDKNKTEIYENDLLKDEQGNIGKVFYNSSSASFAINWHRKDETWDTDNCFEYGEVIGNIYEDYDLIKEAK